MGERIYAQSPLDDFSLWTVGISKVTLWIGLKVLIETSQDQIFLAIIIDLLKIFKIIDKTY